MPPKAKITKEAIIAAAISLVRKDGADAINARTVAAILECSTQPIFSNFATMEELRLAVVGEANKLCENYIQREVEGGMFPAYKASGIAYIRFAKEEKELFKLLYMRDRSNESIPESDELEDKMESLVQHNIGLNLTEAKLFHLEMWAFVHGIATMLVTGFVDLDFALISRMLTDVYQGMRMRYTVE